LEKWKVAIFNAIDDVSDHSERRYSEIDLVYSTYVCKVLYQRLEILVLLELAIGKAKMEENELCTTKDAVLGPFRWNE
jgi:hypothetical protein